MPLPETVSAKGAESLWASHKWGPFANHSVRLILASKTISCWDRPVIPEIQMGSAPVWLDGIRRVHCAPASAKALYSHGADVPRPSDPHRPVNLVVSLLHLAGDRAPLIQVLGFSISCKKGLEFLSIGSGIRSALPLCLQNFPLRLKQPLSWKNPYLCLLFSCNSHTCASRVEVQVFHLTSCSPYGPTGETRDSL